MLYLNHFQYYDISQSLCKSHEFTSIYPLFLSQSLRFQLSLQCYHTSTQLSAYCCFFLSPLVFPIYASSHQVAYLSESPYSLTVGFPTFLHDPFSFVLYQPFTSHANAPLYQLTSPSLFHHLNTVLSTNKSSTLSL